MPTNANTFNSRVTSESLEAKFRQVFPAQGGAELVQDLFASGVIQPVVDFSSVAEGSVLAPNLQTSWDFSTGLAIQDGAGISTAISNPGFWKISVSFEINFADTGSKAANVQIFDGSSAVNILRVTDARANPNESFIVLEESVVFLRSGDILRMNNDFGFATSITYRQIADVNGTLVNPLGFTFQ
jgi:hypothetical protein